MKFKNEIVSTKYPHQKQLSEIARFVEEKCHEMADEHEIPDSETGRLFVYICENLQNFDRIVDQWAKAKKETPEDRFVNSYVRIIKQRMRDQGGDLICSD